MRSIIRLLAKSTKKTYIRLLAKSNPAEYRSVSRPNEEGPVLWGDEREVTLIAGQSKVRKS
jgi:hypothetical protein